MISIKNKFICAGFIVSLAHDDVCSNYTVTVKYDQSGGIFFTRDYKTKGSAMRSYNSWVSKLSVVHENFSVVDND